LYAYDVGLPVHDPFVVVRAWPCWAVPLTTGSAEFEGGDGGAATTAVWAELAVADPPALVALTIDRMVWPTSPVPSV
jgi:hypothetical protein